MLRIAFIHSAYQSEASGENRTVELQAAALESAGHTVELITRRTNDLIKKPGYGLLTGVTVASGIGASPLSEIRLFGPDIVHIHNLFPNWSHRWIDKTGIPTVATIHNFRLICSAATLSLGGEYCDLCPARGSLNSLRHACYQGSRLRTVPLAIATRNRSLHPLLSVPNRVVFPSANAQETFLRYRRGIDAGKTLVIPNFSRKPLLSGASRQKSSGPPQNWLYVGRLSEEKGILSLLRAWPDEEPLTIVGAGPLEAEARGLARLKNVEFAGHVDPSAVRAFMKYAKALVFPSTCMEISPLVLIEALAAGLPIMAKAGNAAAEIVSLHQVGTVFRSFSDVPESVERFEYWRTPARRSKACFEKNFSEHAWLAKTIKMYESVVQDG